MTPPSPWREPGEESIDLYPGLVVHDGRVSGSITVGRSRLPLWAFTSYAITESWHAADQSYDLAEHYGYDAEEFAGFIHDLLEVRGEFARLLLVLAEAERTERDDAWWLTKKRRSLVRRQLQRCLDALGDT